MKTIYCIPDADELITSIVEELPHNRGEAYYALSMVLEMIESRRAEMLAMDPAEAVPEEDEPPMCECDDCCEEYCGEEEPVHHFKMTIDAYGVDDLRAQMRDAYAHTFSAHLGDECIG